MPLRLLLNVLTTDKLLQHGLIYLTVRVNDKKVLALLDKGVTHNFVVRSRVVDISLKVIETSCQVKALNSAT